VWRGVKPLPIADLSIDHDTGHFPQSAWLVRRCSTLQLHGQCRDLLLQRHRDRLTICEQLFDPVGHLEGSKSARLPPVLHRLEVVINHQTASLGFQLLARFDQLLALPVNGAKLFLFFAGHAHDRQRVAVALDEAIQL